MNLKKRIIGLLSVILVLVMAMPLMAAADSEQEYENVVFMTNEEVNAALIAHGVNLDKEIQSRAGLVESNIMVSKVNGYIAVVYYTEATIVANEIGVKSLDLRENSTAVVSDYKDFNCFVQSYRGGFYYTAPVRGRSYTADGTNYAILTTTRYNKYNVSGTITY